MNEGHHAILVIGSANTDMVVQAETIPSPGETVLGGRFQQAFGGKGANQAVAAARLGGEVTFLTSLGTDALGDQMHSALTCEGIALDGIHRSEQNPSGVALIMVNAAGENSIAVAPGANMDLTPGIIRQQADRITEQHCVVLQLEIPLETVAESIKIAREKHATVIVDPAPVPVGGLPDAMLASIDFLLPNEHEARQLTGSLESLDEAGALLLQRGVRHVLITCGDDGVLWFHESGREHFPARPVCAVDTTAAGDAFAGAIAVAFAQHKKIAEAIAFGQQAAAISVTRSGAQPSLPTLDEVLASR